MARSQGVSAVTIRYRRQPGADRIDGRRLLLQAATGLVVASGINYWILDDQHPVQRDRDRAAISHALAGIDRILRPTYDHRPSRTNRSYGPPTPCARRSVPADSGDSRSRPS